jgi:hypothetical protein
MSCILTRCTYDTNLEMIQPLVQESYSTYGVFGFGPLVVKPRIRIRTEIWSVQSFHLGGTYVQSFRSIIPAVTKRSGHVS